MGTMLPKRVLKGKKLPGHMGNEQVTIQNLQIVDVDLENNYILVKGNIPGPKGSLVLIKDSIKSGEKAAAYELISYEVVEEEKVEETTDDKTVEETPEETPATEEKEEVVEETENSKDEK